MATVYYDSSATGADDGTSPADAFTVLQTALNSLSAGDHLYVKKGSSREGASGTPLTFATHSNANDGSTVIEGYISATGDGGLYETSSPIDITADNCVIKFFDIDSGTATNTLRLRGDYSLAYRCKAVNTNVSGLAAEFIDSAAVECAFKTTMSTGGTTRPVVYIQRGYFINNHVVLGNGVATSGCGLRVNTSRMQQSIVGNVIICEDTDAGTSFVGIRCDGINTQQTLLMNNTIFNFNIGIEITEGSGTDVMLSPHVYYGNIIYSCVDGIKNSQGTNVFNFGLFSIQNAFGDITTAQTTNLSHVIDSISLTESPFVDTTDFKLNDASGGGALLKGTLGRPDPADLSSTTRTQFQSLGAMQPAAGSSTTLPTIVSVF